MSEFLTNFIKKKIKFNSWQSALFFALMTVFIYNLSFWRFVFLKLPINEIGNWPFFLALFLMALALTNIIYNLVLWPKIGKGFLSVLLFLNAIIFYYMESYKTVFDKTMMMNVLGSDFSEASELLSPSLLFFIIGLGGIPTLFFFRKIDLEFRVWKSELKFKAISILLSVVVILTVFLGLNKKFTFFFRSHREVKHYLIPLNYLDASRALFQRGKNELMVLEQISENAKLSGRWSQIKSKTVVVLVVGETARFGNFSINGYERNTNPLLSNEEIISFKNTYSCGTATAVSLPCMFSHKNKSDFKATDIYQYENLLDFYKRVGFNVFWLDNNTGCKGVCDRIKEEELRHVDNPKLCFNNICFDEIMLNELDNLVATGGDKILIVMHQLGSHGPAYNKHCPPDFHKFPDSCNKSQLQDCTQEQVRSAYDNTILYTDYFLGRSISLLKNYKDVNTALIYVSDHGESLGENGVYLHGLPYIMAPEAQVHIPFLVWFSNNFVKNFSIDKECLTKFTNEKLSHDNLFHSMLGLVGIETSYKDATLDIFSHCRKK